MGNQFKNVAVIACMKSLLMIFNLVFWFSGMLLLAVGLWAEIELYKYMELSSDFSGTIPYVLIGIGSLIVLVCSLACTCTVKGQPVLLYIYGGFLAVILVLQLGVEISLHAYKHKLSEGFDHGLNQSFINYNAGSGDKSADFDFMQSTLHCCGIHNYSDWLQLVPAHSVPLSCCRDQMSCVTLNTKDIYTEGCYTIITNFIDKNMNLILGVAVGVSLFPLVGLILSCCLANQIKKAKYDVMT